VASNISIKVEKYFAVDYCYRYHIAHFPQILSMTDLIIYISIAHI